MSIEQKRLYVIALVLALLFSGSAFVYKFFLFSPPSMKRVIPVIGAEGSTHAHMSMFIMIKDRVVNFCDPKYMEKSLLVHFEDNNCYVIHKHATGITLVEFLNTIGVDLTTKCMTIPGEEKYCSDEINTLRVVINGGEVPISELSYYELRNNDHILLNYGPEVGNILLFKYNQVPVVPADINKPIIESL